MNALLGHDMNWIQLRVQDKNNKLDSGRSEDKASRHKSPSKLNCATAHPNKNVRPSPHHIDSRHEVQRLIHTDDPKNNAKRDQRDYTICYSMSEPVQLI